MNPNGSSADPNAPQDDIMELDVDMPLFLMSKFCDTALRNLSHNNQVITGQDEIPSASGSSLFPNVFLDSQISNITTYRPKRRGKTHSSTLSLSRSNSYTHATTVPTNDMLNCSDLMEPESQMLSIQRLPNPSNHIKSLRLSEFMNLRNGESPCSEYYGSDAMVLDSMKINKVNGLTSLAKERLESYGPILKNRIENNGKWSGVKIATLGGSNIEDTEHISVFYGVLDKPSSVKTKRLGKLFNDIGVASLPLQSMTCAKKRLFLSDGTGQIELSDLTNKLKFDEVISGIVIAVVGKIKGNCLQVEDVIFATPCSPQWPLQKENNIEMVFVSGLLMGNKKGSNVALDLFQDYLLGLSGSAYEQKEVISKRCRLFLVGNSISGSKSEAETVDDVVEKKDCSLDKLDEFLQPLLDTMEVFIVPGENEPTFTSSFPQPPLHPKLLQESGKYKSLKRLTNPSRIQVAVTQPSPDANPLNSQDSNHSLMNSSIADFLREDVSFIDVLLQSGRNLKESMDYCDISCPIDMGLKLLKWGHLHPTYCDTTYSLAENIFRLHGSLPNLCVIGNLSEFKVVHWNNVKVVGVPSFHKSHTAVVLTRDFDVIPLSFKMA